MSLYLVNKFQGKVKYAVRSVLPIGCEVKTSRCGALGTKSPVNLGGYGVELALKNMEYKAMDDSMIKKSECSVLFHQHARVV